MLGLDTFVIKRVQKWLETAKTEEELKLRATNFMWGVFVIHLLLALVAGWWLYKTVKKKKKSMSGLFVPVVLILICFTVPFGTEKGEELTNVPSSGLFAAATVIMTIVTIIVWFTKKDPQEKKEDDE